MKHNTIQRPPLPNSTPFSTHKHGTDNISSAPWHSRYGSTLSSSTVDVDDRSQSLVSNTSTKTNILSLQSMSKSYRLTAYQQWDRDNMSDIGTFMSNQDLSVLKKNLLGGTELDALRSNLLRKNEQAEILYDALQLTQARIKVIDKNTIDLKHELEVKETTAASRQRSLDKLVSINMMLIDTLDALELQPSGDKDLSKLMISLRRDLLPNIRPEGCNTPTKMNSDMYTMNAKLKVLMCTTI